MRLVIDANIAQAAGSSEIPSSRYCRICLDVVLSGGHAAVFSAVLREEWRNHAGLHAKRWWRSMAARRKIEFLEGGEFAMHLDRASFCLEVTRDREALRKDFHLVCSALAADQIILSNEMDFPRYVALACRKVQVLTTLYYANPAREGGPCIRWVQSGARKEPDRRVAAWVEKHCGN